MTTRRPLIYIYAAVPVLAQLQVPRWYLPHSRYTQTPRSIVIVPFHYVRQLYIYITTAMAVIFCRLQSSRTQYCRYWLLMFTAVIAYSNNNNIILLHWRNTRSFTKFQMINIYLWVLYRPVIIICTRVVLRLFECQMLILYRRIIIVCVYRIIGIVSLSYYNVILTILSWS